MEKVGGLSYFSTFTATQDTHWVTSAAAISASLALRSHARHSWSSAWRTMMPLQLGAAGLAVSKHQFSVMQWQLLLVRMASSWHLEHQVWRTRWLSYLTVTGRYIYAHLNQCICENLRRVQCFTGLLRGLERQTQPKGCPVETWQIWLVALVLYDCGRLCPLPRHVLHVYPCKSFQPTNYWRWKRESTDQHAMIHFAFQSKSCKVWSLVRHLLCCNIFFTVFTLNYTHANRSNFCFTLVTCGCLPLGPWSSSSFCPRLEHGAILLLFLGNRTSQSFTILFAFVP